MDNDDESAEHGETAEALSRALAASDIKWLVRASRECDGDEVDQVRRRYGIR